MGIKTRTVKARESEPEMVRLSELIKTRGDEATDVAPIIVIIDPMERFRDLRQDESFNFSLDAPGGSVGGGVALQTVLRDGPPANVFVFLVCGSAETLSRWLPRASQHDLELRILGQMNQSDSSLLIDTPMAADLRPPRCCCTTTPTVGSTNSASAICPIQRPSKPGSTTDRNSSIAQHQDAPMSCGARRVPAYCASQMLCEVSLVRSGAGDRFKQRFG